jgi:chromosome segregation ATPase
MTPSKFMIARVAQAFGYVRRGQRMADAASEMHLLREAETYLGEMVWQKVEHIEKLSVEYWNLRKLMKEKNAVEGRIDECQARLNNAHQERSNLLNKTPEANKELFDKRAALLAELENLARRRDRIVNDARDVRRAHVGLKMKLEVITSEVADSTARQEEFRLAKERLAEIKTRFVALKEERLQVANLIEEGDKKIDELDAMLDDERLKRRQVAADAFQSIGECNKEMSLLRAESGLLDTQMRQLYGEIGRYVSRNSQSDPSCKSAASSHRGMVDVMRALRRSVALNHRLAELS